MTLRHILTILGAVVVPVGVMTALLEKREQKGRSQ